MLKNKDKESLENVLEGKTNVFIGCVKPTEQMKNHKK
jgi:hypothetical protein